MKSRKLNLSEVMVPIEVHRLKEGDYLATSSVLRGLVAQGRTLAETLEIAQDVARKLIESYHEHGDPLPVSLQRQMHRKSKTTHLQVPVAVNF